ncbi:hypothetical protein FKM82_013111 [Ascaphus truei]
MVFRSGTFVCSNMRLYSISLQEECGIPVYRIPREATWITQSGLARGLGPGLSLSLEGQRPASIVGQELDRTTRCVTRDLC